MITVNGRFLEALEQGVVPAGEDAQAVLYDPSQAEEMDLVDALLRESVGAGTRWTAILISTPS